jgi:hypothetical protein
MFTHTQHLDNLVRHIDLVRENCLLVGKRMIEDGQKEFGRLLIARGFVHDKSKFYGIEWDALHIGPDVDEVLLEAAIKQHTRTNDHHPEYWGGIEFMPKLAIAEMVCDWYARSQEFGTSLKDWIIDNAIDKYKIEKDSLNYDYINMFTNIATKNSFK